MPDIIKTINVETSRRDFLKGAGRGVIGLLAMSTLAGCQDMAPQAVNVDPTAAPTAAAPATAAPVAAAATAAPQATTWATRTMKEISDMGGSTMSLWELNQRRRELVDSKGDYVCPDGTVIPAVWHKLRTLVDTYGFGVGTANVTKENFSFYQMIMSEEEAQAYLEMPYGVKFKAADFALHSGRDEAECHAICEELGKRGVLFRVRHAGVPFYNQVPAAHGLYEYMMGNYKTPGWLETWGTAFAADVSTTASGTPFYRAIPVDKSIVSDGEVLLLDDYEKIIARNTVIGVSPCQCRSPRIHYAGQTWPDIGSEELKTFMSPVCGHPLETCMSFGDEAEYYIENGIARPIDQEEALSILRRSVKAGMVLLSSFSKQSEIICSCHGDCCGILSGFVALGADHMAQASVTPNLSHYNLEYDKEKCAKCGICMQEGACPMYAISPDAEGYPTVDAKCVRCGSCGTICPLKIRTLAAKPVEQRLELPTCVLDDHNLKGAYRFEHDLIK